MPTPYFNPDHPLTVGQGVLNPIFWRKFFESLTAEAFALVDLTTDVTGELQIVNGGTGATTANAAFENLSPMTTRGDLITFNATQPVRLPIGTSGYVLSSDGTDASWQPAGVVAQEGLANTLMLMGG